MSAARLADAFVVRVAGLPLDDLLGLGDPLLHELASRDDEDGARRFAETYAHTAARDRQTLRRVMVDRPVMACALALSSPRAAAEALRDPATRPGKRRRRLEVTLYRYLARACGRPQPEGLWAGVTVARWGAETRVERARPRVSVSPDLAPFQSLVKALAQRRRYAGVGWWRLTPTLVATHDGWEFWARLDDGTTRRRHLARTELTAAILGALAGGARHRWAELLTIVAAATPPAAADASAALTALAAGGVLVGGLDLPDDFADAWAALEAVADDLTGMDAEAWRHAAAGLRRVAAALAEDLGATAARRVPQHLVDAARLVTALSERLSVRPAHDVSRPVLRVDLVAPWTIVLGADLHRVLSRAVSEYDAVQQDVGVAQALGRSMLAQAAVQASPMAAAARRLGRPPDLAAAATWEEVVRPSAASEAARRLRAWERVVTSDESEVTLVTAGPGTDSAPLGCLLAELAQPAPALHGISDQPVQAHARHLAALGPEGVRLHTWLVDALEVLASTSEVEILDLRGPFPPNPNVLAAPASGRPRTRVWGAGPSEVDLTGAWVIRMAGDLPLLDVPGLERPAAVLAVGSADLSRDDPVTDLLLRTCFRVPASQFLPYDLSAPAEAGRGRPSPRVLLPCGVVVRPRRTVLAGVELASLVAAEGAGRFRRWELLALAYGWPELLRVRRAGEPALLVRRDSPVAVEAALHALGDGAPLSVEEVPTPMLRDARGRRYVAEVSVPFTRPVHAWTGYRGGAR